MPQRREKKLMRVVVGGQVLFLVLLAAMAALALISSSTTLDPILEKPVLEKPVAEKPLAKEPPGDPIVEEPPPVTKRPRARRPTARNPAAKRPLVEIPRDAPKPGGEIYPLIFPIPEDGAARLTASFGDPRSGERSHAGEDIMAPKMTPVVAAADGVVIWLHDAKEGRRSCCALTLLHPDGWRTRYIHLNNDTPGTDDGLGYGIVAGLEVGSEVKAGELIGWVGDSGNAEHTGPHLHFELRRPDGTPVDPFPSLLAVVTVDD